MRIPEIITGQMDFSVKNGIICPDDAIDYCWKNGYEPEKVELIMLPATVTQHPFSPCYFSLDGARPSSGAIQLISAISNLSNPWTHYGNCDRDPLDTKKWIWSQLKRRQEYPNPPSLHWSDPSLSPSFQYVFYDQSVAFSTKMPLGDNVLGNKTGHFTQYVAVKVENGKGSDELDEQLRQGTLIHEFFHSFFIHWFAPFMTEFPNQIHPLLDEGMASLASAVCFSTGTRFSEVWLNPEIMKIVLNTPEIFYRFPYANPCQRAESITAGRYSPRYAEILRSIADETLDCFSPSLISKMNFRASARQDGNIKGNFADIEPATKLCYPIGMALVWILGKEALKHGQSPFGWFPEVFRKFQTYYQEQGDRYDNFLFWEIQDALPYIRRRDINREACRLLKQTAYFQAKLSGYAKPENHLSDYADAYALLQRRQNEAQRNHFERFIAGIFSGIERGIFPYTRNKDQYLHEKLEELNQWRANFFG